MRAVMFGIAALLIGATAARAADGHPCLVTLNADAGPAEAMAEPNCTPGDLLIAISGSGNSPNVLRAVQWANDHGLTTYGCTGFTGGKLRALARHGLHVPLDDMGLVESIHLTAFHWVIDDLHRRIEEASGGRIGAKDFVPSPLAHPHCYSICYLLLLDGGGYLPFTRLTSRQRVFFEYVLLDGVNDSPEEAQRLARLLRGVKGKVNLIPFNDWDGSSYRRPPLPRILAFQAILLDAGVTTTVRWSKGEDIGAACGQLKEPAVA